MIVRTLLGYYNTLGLVVTLGVVGGCSDATGPWESDGSVPDVYTCEVEACNWEHRPDANSQCVFSEEAGGCVWSDVLGP